VSLPTLGVPSEFEDGYQCGVATILDISKLDGRYSIDELEVVTSFEGDEEFGRLGWAVGAKANKHGTSDLWISQPYRSTWHGGTAPPPPPPPPPASPLLSSLCLTYHTPPRGFFHPTLSTQAMMPVLCICGKEDPASQLERLPTWMVVLVFAFNLTMRKRSMAIQ